MEEMIISEQQEKDPPMPIGIWKRQNRTNLIQIKSSNICFAMELDTAITCTANNEVINKHISIAVYHLVEFIQGWNGIVFWPNEKDMIPWLITPTIFIQCFLFNSKSHANLQTQ